MSETKSPLSLSPLDWEEDKQDENGSYFNECSSCHLIFIGHKNRVTCKNCWKAAEARKVINEVDWKLLGDASAGSNFVQLVDTHCNVETCKNPNCIESKVCQSALERLNKPTTDDVEFLRLGWIRSNEELARSKVETEKWKEKATAMPSCSYCRGELGTILTTVFDQAVKDQVIVELLKNLKDICVFFQNDENLKGCHMHHKAYRIYEEFKHYEKKSC